MMRLCLVEDLAVAGLEPLTLTRPIYDLRLGCSTLGTKIARAFGVGPGPQRPQIPCVEGRAHVEDGGEEEAAEPEVVDEVEARHRAAVAELRQFLRVDSKFHVGNSRCARP